MHNLSQVFILSAPHCHLDLCSGMELLQQEESTPSVLSTWRQRTVLLALYSTKIAYLWLFQGPSKTCFLTLSPDFLAPTQSDPVVNLAMLLKSEWLGLYQPRFIWSLLWIPKLDPNKKAVNCFPSICCLQAQPTAAKFQGTWIYRHGNVCKMPHGPCCKLICEGYLTV